MTDQFSIPVLGDAIPRRGNQVTKWLALWVYRLSGWRMVGSLPNLPKMVIIGAPHESSWDFFLAVMTIFALGIRANWMGKKSLFRWPITNIMRWLGGIPIDRSARFGIVEQTVAEMNAHDQLVLALAPEGTRKRGLDWKTGFYHIAYGATVPIVMVYVDNPGKTLLFGPILYPSGDLKQDMIRIRAFYDAPYGKK